MVKGHYTYFLASSHQKYFSSFFSKTLSNFVVKVCTSSVKFTVVNGINFDKSFS